ncbi:MAG TPA: sulfotransferase [Gammaproteobacteria bacterium]|nr:sulfotransferase [Gammaproteobacteria bacterium]
MPLQIIGAGLGRTGTMSLKLALEQLGFRACYHMAEIIMEPRRSSEWVAAAAGRADWHRIFDGYAATVDYPSCRFWRELAEFYPSAKVVLSVRDPHDWFESTQATIFSPAMRRHMENSPLASFFEAAVWGDFGGRLDDRDFMVEAFERHVGEVKRTIAPERLLVYEVKQGWEPLCEFLGVDVPASPFPRTNSREELRAMMGAAPGENDVKAPDFEQLSAAVKQRLRGGGPPAG